MDTTIRLIIVDDHSLMRATWKMVLQTDPRIRVIAECASGEEAIRDAATTVPDVMLMDINMSPVNGFEATREIVTAHPEIKIIGLSLNNQAVYAHNMLLMGAKGYVTKNSSREEVLRAIFTVADGGTFVCDEIRVKM